MAELSDMYVTVKITTEYMTLSAMKEADEAIFQYNKLHPFIRFLCGKELARIMHRLEMKLVAVRHEAE